MNDRAEKLLGPLPPGWRPLAKLDRRLILWAARRAMTDQHPLAFYRCDACRTIWSAKTVGKQLNCKKCGENRFRPAYKIGTIKALWLVFLRR